MISTLDEGQIVQKGTGVGAKGVKTHDCRNAECGEAGYYGVVCSGNRRGTCWLPGA